MTRAEERLYSAGYHTEHPKSTPCWYEMAQSALTGDMQSLPAPWSAGQTLWRMTGGVKQGEMIVPNASPAASPLPDWLRHPVRAEPPSPAPLRPSQVLTAPEQPDEAPLAAAGPGILRGKLIHSLLQYLPDLPGEARSATARQFLLRQSNGMTAAEQENILRQALSILNHPDLEELFGPQARAEIAISGEIRLLNGDKRPVIGRIDRLLVTPQSILFVDFKSGGSHPKYLTQMALYRMLLMQIYPEREIRAALIWTDDARITFLPGNMLDNALEMLTAL